jgi:hypothetical protein
VSRNDITPKAKQQITIQKFMLTVIWGIDGFHVVHLMTEQLSYKTQSFLNNIIELLLLAIFPDGGKLHSHRLSMHLDNCRVHHSKAYDASLIQTNIIQVPHPPYRPDLAAWDFLFFGHMMVALSGQQSIGPTDLLDCIRAFLDEIQRSECQITTKTTSINKVSTTIHPSSVLIRL